MAMVTLTSGFNTSLPQNLSSENMKNKDSIHLRDASFSSYLSGIEETFVLKLAESNQNLNSLVPKPHEHIYLGKKKVEDGEIDVFGAEKYFHGKVEESHPRNANKGATRYQQEEDKLNNTDSVKPKIQPGTPSVRSELSWNSRSALLHSFPRNRSQKKPNKGHSKSLLASLGCNCACNDKNSVDIDEQSGENSYNKAIRKEPIKTRDSVRMIKSQLNLNSEEMYCKKSDELGNGLSREDCFSFPVLKSKMGNQAAKVQLQGGDDTPNKPIEVFGSPVQEKGEKSFRLDSSLHMLTWDAIPRVEEIELPPSSNGICNDTESDASSDLFEIESFSNNANPYFARQASDGMSSCVSPTTCYAPSEASIEWSVVTASAADFSAISDSEDTRTAENFNRIALNGKNSPGKEMQKLLPGILLGCKSHKAVRVAGDAYRPSEKAISERRRHHKLDSVNPSTRFQVESKLRGPYPRIGQHGFDTNSLYQSSSARHPSHLLYIQ